MSANTNGLPGANGTAPSSIVRGNSPAVSELTTPSASTRSVADVLRVEGVSLADMGLDDEDQTVSPVRRLLLTPAEEEDLWEIANRNDNPGAGDSDEEEEDELGNASSAAGIDRVAHDDDIERAVEIGDSWADYISSYQGEIDLERETQRLKEMNAASLLISIPGAPIGWIPPCAPDDWVPLAKKTNKKEPDVPFDSLDNPGQWSEYAFRPKFAGKGGHGDYLAHQLPTGAVPVPAALNGKRTIGGFEFFYQGWQKQVPNLRSGATRDNMWPNSRKGSLDRNILTKLGMSSVRMIEETDRQPDALFFHQLILPIHNIDNSKVLTVEGDPRKPFYSNVARWTNMYACEELGILGGGYGHEFKATTPIECLQWDGSVVMDGVLGGSKGAFLRRFDTRKGNCMFSEEMSSTFTKTRWLEIKRCYKLCNNLTAIKKGNPNYEPAYKFNYIWDVICHNTNSLTLFAETDQCFDETSYAFNGWGEAGTGLIGLVMGKPNITRGGQLCLLSDVHRIRPRAYVHRHKLHTKHYNCAGPNEVRLVWEQLQPLLNPTAHRPRSLFREKPHITCDNFFSGDDILSFAATEGFGLTMTCRRDRLPKTIPKKHLCKDKTQVNKRSRAARWMHPIFCIREHQSGALIQLTTFQSTSSCNLIHVNAINSNSLYASAKERGKGAHKRQWGIEMNESRRLYLDSYGRIDSIDHLIKNCSMHYR